MNIQRGRLVSGGRLQVPAEIRRALDLHDGDEVRLEIVDGELRVIPFREVIRRVQEQFLRNAPSGGSQVDDFIAERRAEAERELD